MEQLTLTLYLDHGTNRKLNALATRFGTRTKAATIKRVIDAVLDLTAPDTQAYIFNPNVFRTPVVYNL